MRFSALARLALVPLAATLAAGCTGTYYGPPYYPGYPGGYPGNIAVSWTFAGNSCAQTPGVVQVRISVPSDSVPIYPNTFACPVGTPPGALVIYSYAPGSYLVNLVGLDANGNVIWSGSGTATVVSNQTTAILIDLQPAGASNAVAYLSWGFAPAVGSYYPPCTASGNPDPDRMDSVALYVDGATTSAQTYDCSQGTAGGQVTTPSLTPGPHTLQLTAYQAGLSYAFAQTQPVAVTITANNPTSQSFTFAWQVGGIGVAWTYPDPDACTTGGVMSVTAGFTGAGSSGYTVTGWPCATAVAPFKRLAAVPTGGAAGVPYALSVNALGAPPSPVLFSGTVPVVTIQPGTFYDGTSATVVGVTLH